MMPFVRFGRSHTTRKCGEDPYCPTSLNDWSLSRRFKVWRGSCLLTDHLRARDRFRASFVRVERVMFARDNGDAVTKSSLAVDQELVTKLWVAVASHRTPERPKSNA